jgi:hypothetical protein
MLAIITPADAVMSLRERYLHMNVPCSGKHVLLRTHRGPVWFLKKEAVTVILHHRNRRL